MSSVADESRCQSGMSPLTQPRETDGKFGTKPASRPDRGLVGTPEVIHPTHTCIDCQASVDNLEVFPGPRCLKCWEPIGNEEAKTMTAEKLTKMWGG